MKMISYLLMICVLVVSQAQANVVCCQSEINAHADTITEHQHSDCHPVMAESTPPASVEVQMDHNGITLDDNSCDCPECISHSCCAQQMKHDNTRVGESLQSVDNREPTHIPSHIDRPPTHIL